MSGDVALFLYNPELENVPYPEGHPFNTSRVQKTRKLIRDMGWLSGANVVEVSPEPADRMALKAFHSGRYIQALKTVSAGAWDPEALRMGIGSSDCPVFEGVYENAALACGASLTGARWLIDGKAAVAFNPAGGFHHAFPERAAGFCYLNDVALACGVLAQAGLKVLYLDVDVHNGDGVAYAFRDRRDVMTISLHENPRVLFPGTGFEYEIGEGPGRGYCVNIPLPVGTYDLVYSNVLATVVVPLIDAFSPDVFVLELGVDALAGDPLAHLQLTNNTFVEVIETLRHYRRPILMTGGGGYHIENTVRAWALGWSVLSGQDDGHDACLGMGGVLMESSEWSGGLRDRELIIPEQQRQAVSASLQKVISSIQQNVFPIHGL